MTFACCFWKTAGDTGSVSVWGWRWLLLDFAARCYFYLFGSQNCFEQLLLKLLLNSTCSWRWLGFQGQSQQSEEPWEGLYRPCGRNLYENEPSFLFKNYIELQSLHCNSYACIRDVALSLQNVCHLRGFNKLPYIISKLQPGPHSPGVGCKTWRDFTTS